MMNFGPGGIVIGMAAAELSAAENVVIAKSLTHKTCLLP